MRLDNIGFDNLKLLKCVFNITKTFFLISYKPFPKILINWLKNGIPLTFLIYHITLNCYFSSFPSLQTLKLNQEQSALNSIIVYSNKIA